MKKWWALYLAQSWDRRLIWTAAVFTVVPIALAMLRSSPPTPTEPPGIDTRIPRGFVLVPIEAENFEALDSVLGPYGWVDLFQGGEGARRVVARGVRLLRAPNNPTRFAALVPERRASEILRAGGTFTVVVRRPGDGGTEVEKSSSYVRRRISYED